MKKMLIVGLLLSCNINSNSDKVNQLSPNVKEGVNLAFKVACEPERYDDFSLVLQGDKDKLPLVTQMATPYKIVVNDESSEIIIYKDGQVLTGNECIRVWNVARQVIYEARKNRKPEMSRLEITVNTMSIILDILILFSGGKLDQNNKTVHNNYYAQLERWQANPNKISHATNQGLADCNQAIIDNNYVLNPTWENWALTKGIDGTRLAQSVFVLTVAAATSYASKPDTTSRHVGVGGMFLGGVILSLSFDTDTLQLSLIPELHKK